MLKNTGKRLHAMSLAAKQKRFAMFCVSFLQNDDNIYIYMEKELGSFHHTWSFSSVSKPSSNAPKLKARSLKHAIYN